MNMRAQIKRDSKKGNKKKIIEKKMIDPRTSTEDMLSAVDENLAKKGIYGGYRDAKEISVPDGYNDWMAYSKDIGKYLDDLKSKDPEVKRDAAEALSYQDPMALRIAAGYLATDKRKPEKFVEKMYAEIKKAKDVEDKKMYEEQTGNTPKKALPNSTRRALAQYREGR